MTRRDLTFVLPSLGLFLSEIAESETGVALSFPTESTVFAFDKLPVHYSSGGAATRPVLAGKLPTGETIELHETTLMPGQMPHPPHKHIHTEVMLIREGVVEFIMEGRSEQIGPGGVAYAASGQMHGLKNKGSVPANYFVIAIGAEPRNS